VRQRDEQSSRPTPYPIVIAVAALVVVLAVVALFTNVRTECYGTSSCAHCGARLTFEHRSLAGITYHEANTIRETALSRALSANATSPCRHEWHVLHCGVSSGSLVKWREQADRGNFSSLIWLMLEDEDFARQLGQMPDAQAVWEALFAAQQAAPEEADRLFVRLRLHRPDRASFAEWWAENEARVRQLGGNSGPES
jgi:hypothetical protein